MATIQQPPTAEIQNYYVGEQYVIYNNQHLNNLINDINEQYLYWDKVKYKKIPSSITHEQLWREVKWRRFNMPKVEVSIGNYTFQSKVNNSLQKELHHIDLHFGGSLGKDQVSENDKQVYLINSIMEEAIASSQIEGAVTTRQQAKEMLAKGRAPRNKSEQMIVNNYNTIQYILSIKDQPLTPGLLKDVHRHVVSQTLDNAEDEGRLRQANDVDVIDAVTGAMVYSPPDYKELDVLLHDLCKLFNEDNQQQFIHPVTRACIIHFMIGYIHPFVDGNGRTARALFYWYLLKQGYWLTEYLSISRMIVKTKEQYAKAFLYTETDENDLTYFILYNIKVMRLAYEELKKYIEQKIVEKKQLAQLIKTSGINERQAQVLKWISDEPGKYLTVKEIQNRLAVSNQTARNDLQGLVDNKYLTEINMDKKTKSFHKSELFDKLLKKKIG